jgi:hypothetical protein
VYLFLLDGASCSWEVKLRPAVCLRTQQAEKYALSEGTKEALNLRFLLRDLGFGQTPPTRLFCGNKGAITMALQPANKPATLTCPSTSAANMSSWAMSPQLPP